MDDMMTEHWVFVREEDWRKLKDDLAREVALGELMRKSHLPLVQERDALRDANARVRQERDSLIVTNDELRQQRDRARDLFMSEEKERAALQDTIYDLKGQIDYLLGVNNRITDKLIVAEQRIERLRLDLFSIITERAALCADAPTKEVMTPKHPRWSEFLTALEGPEGCNFHVTANQGTWRCGGGKSKPYAAAILTRMGGIDVPASLDFFDAHGGHCDCERLFNIKDDAEDA